MFTEKMKELQNQIKEGTASIAEKTAKIRAFLNDDKLEDARNLKKELEQEQEKLTIAKNDLSLYENVIEKGNATNEKGKVLKNENEETSYRDKVNAFLHSEGKVIPEGLNFAGKDEVLVPYNEITPTSDGVVKKDSTPVTSEELVTTPLREVKTVVDLKQFTTIHPAKKASGKYPILKRADTKMISVAELEKNPKLAKPEFDKVSWEVVTYRGAIPISEESIDDADVDLVAIVSENSQQIKVNTTNDAIASVMKQFTNKTVANLDEVKAILNVALDPAYNVSFVVSQSFYQILDTLKDGNGRYLLQDSITSASGKVFSDKPIFVLSDSVLGKEGEAKAFVGDIKRAILFADRKDLGLRWADNEIYGQYLQVVARFDVEIADKNAGYFVTFTPTTGNNKGE